MKKLSTLKALPLIGLLAMSLALPAVSMADDDKRSRGHDRSFSKHDGGKSHKSHRGGKSHYDRGRSHKKGHKRGHHKGNKHAYNSHRGHGYKKRGHKHYGHTHKVYRPHNHDHGHVDHVVARDHYDYLSDYDRVRLMLGLHFDNFDLIFRDY